ncbi:hypothetical protein PIB30_013277 [Stylosanthes scabra]|uniref:Uncharacterized protein n=1 Tax=Stylosanthes scabra TaxID=79078 RepID=A0ABU6S706_9FABA|nr:hypothetical protein [Stylosanthes scabra]
MQIHQKGNQEIKKIKRRIAEQISKLYEMMQDTTTMNTLPAQPSQNLKSGINALQHEKKKKGRHVGDEERRSYSLYDLIAQLADSDDEESEVESERGYSDESGEDRVGGEEENEEDSDEDDDESEEEKKNGDWL